MIPLPIPLGEGGPGGAGERTYVINCSLPGKRSNSAPDPQRGIGGGELPGIVLISLLRNLSHLGRGAVLGAAVSGVRGNTSALSATCAAFGRWQSGMTPAASKQVEGGLPKSEGGSTAARVGRGPAACESDRRASPECRRRKAIPGVLVGIPLWRSAGMGVPHTPFPSPRGGGMRNAFPLGQKKVHLTYFLQKIMRIFWDQLNLCLSMILF